mgnify:CR=1 FL=1|tara:strand:+ start:574 stop:1290 length:717 start_codon:yes stop_codon:yes gene_type:complete
MKNLKTMLIAAVAISALTAGNLFAGSFGIGVGGHLAAITADGTETPGGVDSTTDNSVQTATAGNTTFLGSMFAEYNFGDSEAFTLGIDYIPGDADVNSKNISRTDPTSAGTNDQGGVKTANATVSDHLTYYAEMVIGQGVYAKIGYTTVDVITNDTTTSTGTNSSYGNASINAYTLGLGQKGTFGDSGGFYKLEAYMTDYETLNLTGTGSVTTGTSTNSKVSADLDVMGAAVRIGYKF